MKVDSPPLSTATFSPANLIELLRWRADWQSANPAYVFLDEGETEQASWTYQELDERARAIAATLQGRLAAGDRALLLYPPGLDFIAAFLGSLFAGVIAVPAYPPDPARLNRSLPRIWAILRDAQPAAVLTTSHFMPMIDGLSAQHPELRSVLCLATDVCDRDRASSWGMPQIGRNTPAFLQYTSGSTSSPKGVIVTHGNLMHNERLIAAGCHHNAESDFVSWLPLYHDMGLIGGVLQPLYLGSRCVLMSPTAFLQKPLRWLQAISRYRAHTSGGPNFAFDLCIRKITQEERETLDLSSWKVAFNGAEPLRRETLKRFSAVFEPCGFNRRTFFPCYGLAETTLIVSGQADRGRDTIFLNVQSAALEQNHILIDGTGTDDTRTLVGCGQVLLDQRVKIVNPESFSECPPAEVGEIWVSGDSVALGYWNRPEETKQSFGAYISDTGEGPFLRTGDLGFFNAGELFITGRLKDLIIIRGRNHYPSDIELTVERSHEALRAGCGAAFSVDVAGEERLVVVQEIDSRRAVDLNHVIDHIRRNISEKHELQAHAVVLIKPGTISKTSSGKIQRRACRAGFVQEKLEAIAHWPPVAAAPQSQRESLPIPTSPAGTIEAWLVSQLALKLGIDRAAIATEEAITRYGLDSLMAVELAHGLEEELGVSLSMADLLKGLSIAELAAQATSQAATGRPAMGATQVAVDAGNVDGSQYPLSRGQRSLWFLQQLAPESTAYNLSVALRIQQDLDAEAMQRAFESLVERHPSLRTTYSEIDGVPVQQIQASSTVNSLFEDASQWSEAEFNARLVAEANCTFDLTQAPPVRVHLFKRAAADYTLLLVLHHIAADFWSLAVLVYELAQFYSAHQSQGERVPPLNANYRDFVEWQARWLESGSAEEDWRYWQKQLGGELPVLNLSIDNPRPPAKSYRGASLPFALKAALTADLKRLSREQGGTLYMTLLAAYQLLLHRYTGQRDIIVGSPTTGRAQAGFDGVIGYFVNPLPLRSRISAGQSFQEHLNQVRQTALAAFEHQNFPFDLMVERLHPERELSRSPLFQTMFVFEKSQLADADDLARLALGEAGAPVQLGALSVAAVPLQQRVSQFDLTLMMAESEGVLFGSLQYDTDLFEPETIARMAANFEALLEEIVSEPNRLISETEMLSRAEQEQLTEWNATAVDYGKLPCMHELFEDRVRRSPDATALIFGEEFISYDQLNRRANQLGHYFRSLGVGPEVAVAVCLKRSPRLVATLLGILKAGGTYVPLDPAYPKERTAFVIDNAQSPLLLTESALPGNLPQHSAQTICLDVEREAIERQPSGNLHSRVTADHLAYVIYTSGSTGQPKGVAIDHRSATGFVRWAESVFTQAELASVLAATSICFDLSIFELFVTLSAGGKVILVENALTLPETTAKDSVTLINTVPSAMAELVRNDEIPRSVRTVNLAGEPLQNRLAQAIYQLPHIDKVYNLYGPSEDTTYTTFALIERGAAQAPPIGRPLANTQIHLVGSRFEPVPIGAAGELYIGSESLARGYLNRPELTAERFVPNPFATSPGERLYRTGDIARYLADGNLDFLGRADHQVKIRGYRIELGEIEALLHQHPAVRDAVVVACEGAAGEKRLAAYVSLKPNEVLSVEALTAHLKQRLPDYMLPSGWVILDEMPLTPNGKVDRKALPSPAFYEHGAKDVILAANPAQEIIAGIWSQVLGCPQIDIHDDFFQLGGHSLLATQAVSRLRKAFQLEIPLSRVFESPTVVELAGWIESALAGNREFAITPPARAGQDAQPLLSFAQQRMWFLDQLDSGSAFYNMPGAIRLLGALNLDALEQSIHEIVRRHDVLRSRFVSENGRPSLEILPSLALKLEVIDLSLLTHSERDIKTRQLAAAESQHPFDLAHGPLLRIKAIKLADTEHVLLVTMHHIVSDGWSLGVFMREMIALYEALEKDAPSPLAELPIQYADFARWQRDWLRGDALKAQLAYWQKQLEDAPSSLKLPTDKPRPPVQTTRGARESLALSPELTEKVKQLSMSENATLFMTLLAAFKVLLYRYSGQADILVGSPVANRRWLEIEGLIGFFSNTLVLRTRLDGQPSFRDLLKRVKTTALGAYAHQDLPFEKLVEELRPERDPSKTPFFQVMFALESDSLPVIEREGLKLVCEEVYNDTAKFDLTLTVEDNGQGLIATLEYNRDLFKADTIRRMATGFATLLEEIVKEPERSISELEVLNQAEREQLAEWNATAVDYGELPCMHELFEERVRHSPDAIAVTHEGESSSFRQLDRRANQLAHHLRAQGVGPEAFVGIYMKRSPDLLVALLGVLKAGGAYLPLDISSPQGRLAFMLKDAGATVLLTQADLLEKIDHLDIRTLCIDREWPIIAGESCDVPASQVTADNPAYVIYTSGSTGQPKGVVIPHHAFVDDILTVIDHYGIKEQDRLLQFTSISFDMSAEEVFPGLLAGARLVLRTDAAASAIPAFLRQCRDEGISVLNLPTAYWHELSATLDASRLELPTTVRLVVIGGERALRERWALWQSRVAQPVRLLNTYGPTETTITATVWEMSEDATAGEPNAGVPIGRPLANHKAYLLDQHTQLSPIGLPGELHIAGAGLARGYLNRPELTAEKFMPNPFSGAVGARLYKTGDSVRYLANGDLDFIGRVDNQVKIRGFRIELQEIEALLREAPEVAEAMVLAQEATTGAARLVAYLVPEAGSTPTAEGLRSFLRQRLPDYMVPSLFVVLAQLPLTASGKVDRQSLATQTGIRLESSTSYAAPQSDLEQQIAAIWQDVLNVERVGLNDNFFDLGGHSLLITQVHSRLSAIVETNVSIVDLFKYPTVRLLAASLAQTPAGLATAKPMPLVERAEAGTASSNEIAIIGMAGRFPQAANVTEFWENLRNGVEAISTISDKDLLAAGIDQRTINDPTYVKAGAFLEGTDLFDAAFFGYTPREAEVMDPQQRIFLETAWGALEDAGYDPATYPGRIGVVAGTGSNDYMWRLYANLDQARSVSGYQIVIGNDKDHLVTRVSYKLNLRGPSLAVQTACSTSLVAVHLACKTLLGGECEMALAGGISITSLQKEGYFYQDEGALSPDGHCRAFDAQARGTVTGNGVGIVVLKRLDTAIADGDTIHAVIKGSAINNDGSLKVGYTAPSVEGQTQVITAAQQQAGVAAETIEYIEAHGTGTLLGDPIEIAALTQAFRAGTDAKGFCAIGSVKTNLGHLDSAAGVAGLMKVVLSLKHGMIPPSLNFDEPNPRIGFQHTPFYVNDRLTDWPSNGHPRRAGVSSFGLGGTNAHLVVEEAPAASESSPSRPYQLLLLSARSAAALDVATANLADYLQRNPTANLADVAYTLQVGRTRFKHRRALVCADVDGAASTLAAGKSRTLTTASSDSDDRPVAFMFPGGGAQHVNMAQELYQTEQVFRQQVDHCAEILKSQAGYDIRDYLYPEPDRSEWADEQLKEGSIQLPAIFIIDYALARLLMSCGVRPASLIGHSLGEYVAACLAGVFSLEDALTLIFRRAQLLESLPAGAMLSVMLSEAETRSFMSDDVSMAAINSLSLCVVSGPAEAINEMAGRLRESGVHYKVLPVRGGGHRQEVDLITDAFLDLMGNMELHAPRIPFISNVTGTWIKDEEAVAPRYWAKHLRQTVRFAQGIDELVKSSNGLLAEVGPGQGLTALARAQLGKEMKSSVVPMMRHQTAGASDGEFLLAAIGKLWTAGAQIDWAQFYADEQRHRVSLPTYPFERQRYWVEPPDNTARRNLSRPSAGKQVDVEKWFYVPSWTRSSWRSLTEGQLAGDPRLVWLLFVDDCGLGSQVGQRLEDTGHEVISVITGDQFEKLADNLYTIGPDQKEDYEALVSDLMISGKTPQRIVHLWSVSHASDAPSSERIFQEQQTSGFYSLLHLAQSFGSLDQNEPVPVTIISSHSQEVTGGEPLRPEKASLIAQARIISQEYENLPCRNVDITLQESSYRHESRLIEQLLSEVLLARPEPVAAYRNGHRWVQNYEAIQLDEANQGMSRLKHKGVYLITGGLGGGGMLMAESLACTVQARLALTSRSPFPPQENWGEWLAAKGEADPTSVRIRRLQAMIDQGAELMIVRADVADEAQMRAAVNRLLDTFGDLNGVIHAVGYTGEDGVELIPGIGRAQCENHLQTKVYGLYTLEKVLRDRPLDFCLLCSSLTTVIGGMGSLAFSAANAFMDGFATYASSLTGTDWVSVNWEGWLTSESSDGLVAQLSADEYAMKPAEGVSAFERLVRFAPAGQVIVSTGDLDSRRALLNRNAVTPESEAIATTVQAASHPRPDLETAYVAPTNEVEIAIADIWKEVLGVEEIGLNDNFFELGGHSLLAVQVISRLRASFGVTLPLRGFFESATVKGLADKVGELLIAELENLTDEQVEQMLKADQAEAPSPAN